MERIVSPWEGSDLWLTYSAFAFPRASPWADLWLPPSGRQKKAQHQNWRVGLVFRQSSIDGWASGSSPAEKE
jgi:hypothetical protein